MELHALNQFQTFYAPSGRCWHFLTRMWGSSQYCPSDCSKPMFLLFEWSFASSCAERAYWQNTGWRICWVLCSAWTERNLHQHNHILRAGHVTFVFSSFSPPFLSMSIAFHATHSAVTCEGDIAFGHSIWIISGRRPLQISHLVAPCLSSGRAPSSPTRGYVLKEKALLAFALLACRELRVSRTLVGSLPINS